MSCEIIIFILIMKNEGFYVFEWLVYYKLIGIDMFLIYFNDCIDGINLMLNWLYQMGVIIYFDNL